MEIKHSPADGRGHLIATLISCLALAACGQAAPPASSAKVGPGPGGPAQAKGEYRPGFGDLMTSAVQPRHTKLRFARLEKNWAYAAYELDELENALNRIARTFPTYRKNDLPKVMEDSISGPVEALKAAIAARDEAAFDRAYADLTVVCNDCHKSQEHAEIVIKVPTSQSLAFPGQDFRPRQGLLD